MNIFCNKLFNVTKKIRAFSLVEMGIVLIIIGLITSSVIVGQDMIRQAQINLLVSQVNQVKDAVNQFRAIYGSLPGDFADSSQAVAGGLVGNGNGSVDNATNPEQIYFWLHLANANLYPGNFTGNIADQYKLATKGFPGGVPTGAIPGSGYSIVPSSTVGLVLLFSGYSSVSNTLSIIKPKEAYQIDLKFDNGDPLSGNILAFDGSDVAANSCVTIGGVYNTGLNSNACTLQFVLEAVPEGTTPGSQLTCTGSSLGTTRVSSTATCPWGQYGTVIEECVQTSPVTAIWKNTQFNCSPTSCGNGRLAGDTWTTPCPYGWTGNIVFTCQSGGVYSINSTGCAINAADPCTRTDANQSLSVRNLSCPLGKTGYVTQTCYSPVTVWTTVTNACTAQYSCPGAIAIGSTDGSSLGCGNAQYTGSANIPNICALSVEPAEVALTRPLQSLCMPNYGTGACVPGTTRIPSIGCPAGYTGDHTQVCNSAGYYDTVSNTCMPIMCGQDPIGSFKLSKDFTCNMKETGFVYDVCQSTGTYKPHFNCTTRNCVATVDITSNSGFATYNAAAAHGNYNASTCDAVTYTNNIANPSGGAPAAASRRCGFDGTWQARNLPCFAASCPALNVQNTSNASTGNTYYTEWPLTVAAEQGSYTVVTLPAPGTNAGAPRCNTNFPTNPQSREITTDTKVICNAKGQWVDFCSAAAQNITVNSRIQAIAAMSHQNLGGRIQDQTATPIEFWNDSSANSNNYLNNLYNFCDGVGVTSTQDTCLSCLDDICTQ